MLKPLKAKPRKSVAVSKNQRFDLPPTDFVHQQQELLALEIQAATDLLDELDIRQAFRHKKFFQHLALIDQIRFLSRARYETVRHRTGWLRYRISKADELADLPFRIQASVAVCPCYRNQPALAFLAFNVLTDMPNSFATLPGLIVLSIYEEILSRAICKNKVYLLDLSDCCNHGDGVELPYP